MSTIVVIKLSVTSRKYFLVFNTNDDCSAKTFIRNQRLQIFIVLHYFGELIAIGVRQFMVGETVDSILVKEGGVEITFIFHSICLISQCCFYQHIMVPYTLNIYEFQKKKKKKKKKNL